MLSVLDFLVRSCMKPKKSYMILEAERLDQIRFIRFCLIRSANEPPVCFLTVFDIVFFSDCFGDFFSPDNVH